MVSPVKIYLILIFSYLELVVSPVKISSIFIFRYLELGK